MHRKKSTWWLVAALALLSGSAAHAQIIHGQPAHGSTGVTYTHWKLATDSGGSVEINQLWAPVSGMVPLADNTEAAFFFSGARSDVDFYGYKTDLNGASDTRFQVSRSMAEDRLLFSIGVSLPTGKKELNPFTERVVVETLAQNFLDFPLRRYGEGLGLSFLAGTAAEFGEVNAGVGLQYEYIGSYTPYEDIEDYDPGDLFNIYAGGDISRGDIAWSGNLLFTTFVADKIGGVKILKQSTQLEIQLGGIFDNKRHRLNGEVSYTIRGRNERYGGPSEEVIERLKLYGNEFSASAGYTAILQNGWSLGPSLSLKLVEGDEEEFGKSTIFSASGSVAKQVGEQLSFNAGARYMTGTADDSRYDLTGYQLTAGLSATL